MMEGEKVTAVWSDAMMWGVWTARKGETIVDWLWLLLIVVELACELIECLPAMGWEMLRMMRKESEANRKWKKRWGK